MISVNKLKEELKLFIFLLHTIYKISNKYLVIVISIAAIQAFVPFVLVIMPALIIDELTGNQDIQKLLIYVVCTVVITFLCNIMEGWLKKYKNLLSLEVQYQLDLKIGQRFMHMAYKNLEDPKVHDLRQKVEEAKSRSGDVQSLLDNCFNMIMGGLSLIGYGAILLSLIESDQMVQRTGVVWIDFITSHSFIGLCVLLIFNIMNAYIQAKSNGYFYKFIEEAAPINREYSYYKSLEKDYRIGQDIRLQNGYGLLKQRMNEYISFSQKFLKKLMNEEYKYTVCSVTLVQMQTFLIYAMITLKVFVRSITVGSFYMYIQAVSNINSIIRGIFSNFTSIRRALTYYGAYEEILKLEDEGEYGEALPEIDEGYKLCIENLWFKYPGSSQWILKDFSMTLEKGKTIALVGLNGAGKSTLIKLILRLYTPSKGRILLNGKDINLFDKRAYYQLFSVVFQDFKLFACSVAENVAGDTKWDTERLNKVIETVGMEKVLERYGGVEAPVTRYFEGDGIEFSGGESQKIAIARALYRDTAIVIMDEPTAALDPISEYEIYEQLNQLMKGRTALMISHRLSSCRLCEKIIVMDEGIVLETGSHEELLEKKGLYHKLWTTQSQYYTNIY